MSPFNPKAKNSKNAKNSPTKPTKNAIKSEQKSHNQHKVAANEVAKSLLDIGAISIRPNEPFTLTSKRLSPVYVDCRKILSHPVTRELIIDQAFALLESAIKTEGYDVIAGGETGGIPFAALLAHKFKLPMVYVRKRPKGVGRKVQVEGTLHNGARVLLVEDLYTNGKSKKVFVKALRDAGATVKHVFVVFYNELTPLPEKMGLDQPREPIPMNKLEVKVHSLANWVDMLSILDGERKNYFPHLTDEEYDEFKNYLNDPEAWSDKAKTQPAFVLEGHV
ncbi:MAG: orotate phosphoribosyltransferase [Candidatus Symbiobacter sp.]|nr:orotate phosphoribosyltransferase [Candidatus Symbiobacter sp.]